MAACPPRRPAGSNAPAPRGNRSENGAAGRLERDEFSFDFRRHCERREAISSHRHGTTKAGDCFASLAMTIRYTVIKLYPDAGTPIPPQAPRPQLLPL